MLVLYARIVCKFGFVHLCFCSLSSQKLKIFSTSCQPVMEIEVDRVRNGFKSHILKISILHIVTRASSRQNALNHEAQRCLAFGSSFFLPVKTREEIVSVLILVELSIFWLEFIGRRFLIVACS